MQNYGRYMLICAKLYKIGDECVELMYDLLLFQRKYFKINAKLNETISKV